MSENSLTLQTVHSNLVKQNVVSMQICITEVKLNL